MDAAGIAKRRSELADEVVSLSLGKLLLKHHFFSAAVGRLRFGEYGGTVLTNGKDLRYDAEYLLKRYEKNEMLPVHDILHALLHNVFRHWDIGAVEPSLWDAACDIAAEAVIAEISPELVPPEEAEKRAEIISSLSLEVKPLTAEKLYNYLHRSPVSEKRLSQYRALFSVDDHRPWHRQNSEPEKEPAPDLPNFFPELKESGDTEETEDKALPESDDEQAGNGNNDSKRRDGGQQSGGVSDGSWLAEQLKAEKRELERQWRETAKQIRSEMESFGRGGDTSRLIDMLRAVSRERTDYRSFLRRFAVAGEVMKPDLDAFDVSFYCYGMGLYGDVAFIEPPEYREVKRIKEFVIAIDTSGSVSGGTVHKFVQKTYNILKSEESFFSRVNIHILQCDTRIEDSAVITCEEDIERYIGGLELKGLGGTDFRPVFGYVDSLRASGELSGLKGLIYFTDGDGIYPDTAPDYETAFVFIEGDYERSRSDVPPWAVKLVLDEGEVLDDE